MRQEEERCIQSQVPFLCASIFLEKQHVPCILIKKKKKHWDNIGSKEIPFAHHETFY